MSNLTAVSVHAKLQEVHFTAHTTDFKQDVCLAFNFSTLCSMIHKLKLVKSMQTQRKLYSMFCICVDCLCFEPKANHALGSLLSVRAKLQLISVEVCTCTLLLSPVKLDLAQCYQYQNYMRRDLVCNYIFSYLLSFFICFNLVLRSLQRNL